MICVGLSTEIPTIFLRDSCKVCYFMTHFEDVLWITNTRRKIARTLCNNHDSFSARRVTTWQVVDASCASAPKTLPACMEILQ